MLELPMGERPGGGNPQPGQSRAVRARDNGRSGIRPIDDALAALG